MYSAKSYKLTVDEYNYLLPVLRVKLLYSNGMHFFIGTSDELSDMLNRLKGLYDMYDELNSMTGYKCFINANLKPFRDQMILPVNDIQ